MRVSRHIGLYLLLLVIAVVVVALSLWLASSEPVKVAVATVSRGTVQRSVANTRAGTVKACRRAGISPLVGGQIVRLGAQEGDRVKQGQLLMALWDHDQRAQLELATSQVKTAQAKASQACIKSEIAQREAGRLRRLREERLASEEAADNADGDARAQSAACRAARAGVAVARARVDVAKSKLDQTRLTAPFDGIVAEVNGEVGEFVTPSPLGIPTPPAVDLIATGCLYVSAPIDEVDAPQIRVGMRARIALDAMPDRVFEGRVRRIAPYILEVRKQARTLDVEVDFVCPEECGELLPGYSADIEVILQEESDRLRVPTEAIMEGKRVLVLGRNGRLEARSIETGLANWAWSEVTRGLQEGEKVVVSLEREGVAAGVEAVADTSTRDD
ncbi:MAG TPA: efflux RND transporter periplasmic adaptor subunit [Sedimenticola sp.]|nr:efflux RND transporter periplasmic adaptor subunit [Sedimenticola sp.]